MQSTGVYWLPVYEILTERGFRVFLVNAGHTKNLPGRKSDVQECQWLMKLHTYGLLNDSFRPTEEICVLRTYWRQRDEHVKAASATVQRMQKVLTEMNVQIANVISDISGVTGMAILDAILNQERDIYREYHKRIGECDEAIQAHLKKMEDKSDPGSKPEMPKAGKRAGGNAPRFDLRSELYRISGIDLTRIDGINVMNAQTIIAEIGLDMSRWPSEAHFASWLGLRPDNKITGGKVYRRGSRHVENRAATAFRMAATSLWRSKTYLGAKFKRLRAQLGAPKAITAMAHNLARLVYRMLKYGQEYVDQGTEFYQQQYQQQQIKWMQKRAMELGLVISLAPGETQWKQGLPLLRLQRERIYQNQGVFDLVSPNMFAGSILDLEPDTVYEARFVMSDPDGFVEQSEKSVTKTVTVRTRPEPKPYSGGRVFHVYPTGYKGTKIEPAFDAVMCAYNYYCGGGDTVTAGRPRVKAGDTILVHAGLYKFHAEYYTGDRSINATTPFEGTNYFI
jgi:transposase